MFDGAVAKDDEGAKDSDITKEKSKDDAEGDKLSAEDDGKVAKDCDGNEGENEKDFVQAED